MTKAEIDKEIAVIDGRASQTRKALLAIDSRSNPTVHADLAAELSRLNREIARLKTETPGV